MDSGQTHSSDPSTTTLWNTIKQFLQVNKNAKVNVRNFCTYLYYRIAG